MTNEGARSKHRTNLSLLFLALVLMVGLVMVATPASALNTAVWSSPMPADGAIATAKPTSPVVTARDGAPIFKATATMNGVPASFINLDRPVGYTEYNDEAEEYYWVVTDYTVARVMAYFPASAIVPGTNTIVTTVTSALGVSTYTRTFSFGSVTSISGISPASGAILPSSPSFVSATMSSLSTAFTTTMRIDGVLVPTTYNAGTKTFTRTVTPALAPGTHTVVFTARDAVGATTSRTWTFKVQPPMSTGGECLTCHASSATAHPVSGCTSCHSTAYAEPGRHGGEVPSAAGCTGYDPATACHLFNHGGDVFQGSGPFSCAYCHDAAFPAVPRHTDSSNQAAHDSGVIGCEPCHSASLIDEHAKYPASATIKHQCDLCHGATVSAEVRSAVESGDVSCDACHSGTSQHESLHTLERTDECVDCHEGASLTTVHASSSCEPCHTNASSTVAAAVAAGDKSCSACHGAQPHPNSEAVHSANMTSEWMPIFDNHDGMGALYWNTNCNMCHASSQLLTIHANDCGACHGGSKPADSFTTWNKSCSQGSCHPSVTHNRASAAHDSIANQNCDTCHEPSWAVYNETCDWCHNTSSAGTPPVTSANLKSTYVGSAPIVFSAPGVAYTYYKVNGGARQRGSSITIPGPSSGTASYSIEYWSVNDSGREELPHKTASFTISADTVAPVTTSNAVGAYAGPTTITLSVSDNNESPVPGTYWRLNGGSTNSGKTVSIAQPASGTQAYTLEFWSVDAAGNEELPHKTVTFTVSRDTVPPVTSHNAPRYVRNNYGVICNLTAVDPAPGSGVAATYRRVSGTTFQSNWFYLPYGQGNYTIEYWSTDRAGNVEATKNFVFTRDWTAPVTTSNAVSAYTGPATITLSPTDSVSGIESTRYILDGGPEAVGTVVVANMSGSHTLKFWSVDKAGNVEAQKTVNFTVTGGTPDTTPPITTSDAATSYANAATIRLTATDIGGTGVASTRYRLNGGPETVGTTIAVAGPASGSQTHTLEFWSVDVAGNVESPKTVTFTITYQAVGTMTFQWYALGASWADYRIYDADNRLVISISSAEIPNWNGFYTATVPINPRPYRYVIDWYDDDWEEYGTTEGTALIDTPGKAFSTWY